MDDMKQFNSISSFEPLFAKKANNEIEKEKKEDPIFKSTLEQEKPGTIAASTSEAEEIVNKANKNKFANITVESLIKMGNDFLVEVNKKRDQDQAMNDEFEKTFTGWASDLANKVKEINRLQASQYSQIISEKFNLISEELDQIEKLEHELANISNEVKELHKAINLSE